VEEDENITDMAEESPNTKTPRIYVSTFRASECGEYYTHKDCTCICTTYMYNAFSILNLWT